MTSPTPRASSRTSVRLRTGGRFHREMTGLAEGLGVSWRELCLANISYDLILSIFGCSTVALPGPDGPAVARNLDWFPERELARSSCVLDCERGGETRFIHAGWPGAVGVVTGLSMRGFALIVNAVSGLEGVSRLGYPVLLHLRRVLECAADFDAALKSLKETRLAAPCLLTLVGSENHQRVAIERTPRRAALRWPEGDAPLIVTNHYIGLYQQEAHGGGEIYETTCRRYDALGVLFSEHDAEREPEDEALLAPLCDPEVLQSITAQQVLIRPRRRSLKLYVPERLLASAVK